MKELPSEPQEFSTMGGQEGVGRAPYWLEWISSW